MGLFQINFKKNFQKWRKAKREDQNQDENANRKPRKAKQDRKNKNLLHLSKSILVCRFCINLFVDIVSILIIEVSALLLFNFFSPKSPIYGS